MSKSWDTIGDILLALLILVGVFIGVIFVAGVLIQVFG